MLADLTDYDGFTVTKATSNGTGFTLELNSSLQKPLTAAHMAEFPVERSGAGTIPAPDYTDATTFKSVFNRVFKYAKAAYVVSSTNKSFVTPLSNVDTTNNKFDISCANISTYGISGDFSDATVFPVLSVSYLVNNCTINSKPSHCLIRCYGDPFASNINSLLAGYSDHENCQVLLKNVTEFDIFPLGKATGNAMPILNSTNNVSSKYNAQTMPISKIEAVSFKISAYSDRIVPNVVGTTANTTSGAFYYDAQKKGHAVLSVEGTALLKTPNMATGSTAAYNNGLSGLATSTFNVVTTGSEGGGS